MHSLSESGFDRVVSFYDPLARIVFGDAQLQAQKVLLPFIRENSDVLIVGGGSGWLLEQVLKTGNGLRIVYLDASPRMVSRARDKTFKQIAACKNEVQFRVGTEKAIQSEEAFDVIITPFLLDLFPDQRLATLMKGLNAALRKDGQWLFADFWPVEQPAPLWQRLLLKAMYIFFGAVSGVRATRLPDFSHHFKELQMQEIYTESFYKGMIQAKVFMKQSP